MNWFKSALFNILEERDVQIRGYPVTFDIDVLILFSANPSTFNRSGKVIPQLKDRIGSTIQTHYPLERDMGIQIMEQESDIDLDGDYPVRVPYFMKEICEQITIQARKSKYVDHSIGRECTIQLLPTIKRWFPCARASGRLAGRKTRRSPDQRPWGTFIRLRWASSELDLMGTPSDG